jgi:hypothetical protein
MIPAAVDRMLADSPIVRPGLVDRVRVHFPLKLKLYLGLSIVFCVPYFVIQRLPWIHPRTLPLTWIDEAIGYRPGAIYAYQSVYVLIPLLPFVAITRDELSRYARGFLMLCTVSFTIFLLFPVAGPRPEQAAGNWMTQLVFSYDRNLNAFPSLHAGLAAYSVLFGSVTQAGRLVVICTLWLLVIMFATLATKQHYFLDLPPALLLAWLAHRWAGWQR